jgi:Hg(II)-responsive transcriptional regulator
MRIGQLARKTGAERQTIRYYESLRLLDEPQRNSSGYRVYDNEAARRLMFIKRAKSIGLTLNEIRTLIEISVGKANRCEEIRDFAADKLRDVREKIYHLQTIEKALSDLKGLCDNSGDSLHCPFIENLLEDCIKEH